VSFIRERNIMPEKILLIGDTRREMQLALSQASPDATVVGVASVFDAIAELSSRSFNTVLTAAEPIERRPESAVRALRQLAGGGRLLLYGHPTLEPLSRKMLQFGVDDYLVTPATSLEMQQALTPVGMRLAEAIDGDDPPRQPESPDLAKLRQLPLAEILLDALIQSPCDAASVAVSQINAHLDGGVKLSFVAPGAEIPTGPDHRPPLTQAVRSHGDDLGTVTLLLGVGDDESSARHFLAQFAHLVGKVAGLQDRHVRLQRLAITDDLTGLYNGRYFRHYLNKIVEKARTLRFPVTLFLFDIDNFKKYNDQYGHGVGDEILRQTATLMKKCVRDHDLVARISGDEFAVVFWEKEGPRQPRDQSAPAGAAGRPPQTPVQILERFRRLLSSQSFTGLGPAGQGTLTISGGLAVFPYDAHTVDQLVEAADKALMFKAKKSGKNSIFLVGGLPPAG
jgi:two-component system cell cycle response regulator